MNIALRCSYFIYFIAQPNIDLKYYILSNIYCCYSYTLVLIHNSNIHIHRNSNKCIDFKLKWVIKTLLMIIQFIWDVYCHLLKLKKQFDVSLMTYVFVITVKSSHYNLFNYLIGE